MIKMKLDYFTRFVSWSSYDFTQSTPRQFPIDRDIIQWDSFVQFIFGLTIISPRGFSDNHEFIQALYSFWNYIQI